MLPGRPISGGSVLSGQVQDAEKALVPKSGRNHTFCSELTRAWNTPGMASPYVDVQQLLS
jgi:hypothetical protein